MGREALAPVPRATPRVYLLVSSGPEDGQDEDGGDGRSQVAGDSLDVDVELATAGALQDGDPDHAEGHQHHRDHPASGSHAVRGDVSVLPATPCTHMASPWRWGGPRDQGLGPSAGTEMLAGGCRQVSGRMLAAR